MPRYTAADRALTVQCDAPDADICAAFGIRLSTLKTWRAAAAKERGGNGEGSRACKTPSISSEVSSPGAPDEAIIASPMGACASNHNTEAPSTTGANTASSGLSVDAPSHHLEGTSSSSPNATVPDTSAPLGEVHSHPLAPAHTTTTAAGGAGCAKAHSQQGSSQEFTGEGALIAAATEAFAGLDSHNNGSSNAVRQGFEFSEQLRGLLYNFSSPASTAPQRVEHAQGSPYNFSSPVTAAASVPTQQLAGEQVPGPAYNIALAAGPIPQYPSPLVTTTASHQLPRPSPLTTLGAVGTHAHNLALVPTAHQQTVAGLSSRQPLGPSPLAASGTHRAQSQYRETQSQTQAQGQTWAVMQPKPVMRIQAQPPTQPLGVPLVHTEGVSADIHASYHHTRVSDDSPATGSQTRAPLSPLSPATDTRPSNYTTRAGYGPATAQQQGAQSTNAPLSSPPRTSAYGPVPSVVIEDTVMYSGAYNPSQQLSYPQHSSASSDHARYNAASGYTAPYTGASHTTTTTTERTPGYMGGVGATSAAANTMGNLPGTVASSALPLAPYYPVPLPQTSERTTTTTPPQQPEQPRRRSRGCPFTLPLSSPALRTSPSTTTTKTLLSRFRHQGEEQPQQQHVVHRRPWHAPLPLLTIRGLFALLIAHPTASLPDIAFALAAHTGDATITPEALRDVVMEQGFAYRLREYAVSNPGQLEESRARFWGESLPAGVMGVRADRIVDVCEHTVYDGALVCFVLLVSFFLFLMSLHVAVLPLAFPLYVHARGVHGCAGGPNRGHVRARSV